MATEVYAKAPIVEAGLDIRVRAGQDVSLDELELARDSAYPQLFQKPTSVEVKLNDAQSPDAAAQLITKPMGFTYRSADEKRAFQVRLDGFSHNRMAPYKDWQDFVQEARRLWPIYKKIAKPEFVELVGLNYLNQILVPYGSSFEDFFTSYIKVPLELPQDLNNFTMGYQLSIPQDRGFLHISQAYGPQATEGFVTINLNIQAFKQINVPIAQITEDELWKIFGDLRIAKDNAFEACITDKVREAIR